MKHKTVRALTLLLVLLMLLASVVSCTEKPVVQPSDDSTSTTPVSGDENDPNLAPVDYEGYEFCILTHDEEGFWAEEDLGRPINDAVFRRNTYLEEKYGIVIKVETCTFNGYLSKIERASMGDITDAFDLINASMAYAYQLSTKGYLLEMDQYPVVNLTRSYWWQNVLEDTSVAGKNYFAINDSCLESFYQMSVVIFNKTIAAAQEMENFFDMVKEGDWTLEAFCALSKEAYTDATGDGVTLDDTFGTTGNSYMTDCLIYGWDMLYVEKNENNLPVLNISDNQKFFNAFESVVALFNDKTTLYGEFQSGQNARQTVPEETFRSGRSLFWVESLGWAETLRAIGLPFGLLPMPKIDKEQQEYTNCIHAWASTAISVLKVSTDLTRTGTILEDMAYISQKEIRPTYYDIILNGRIVYDAESYEMLPYILDNIRVDLAMVFRQSGFTLVDDLRTIATNNSNAAARLPRYLNSYRIILERLTESFISEPETT